MMLVFMGGTPVVHIEISGFSHRTPVCTHQICPLTRTLAWLNETTKSKTNKGIGDLRVVPVRRRSFYLFQN
jgi:hypothetical protein